MILTEPGLLNHCYVPHVARWTQHCSPSARQRATMLCCALGQRSKHHKSHNPQQPTKHSFVGNHLRAYTYPEMHITCSAGGWWTGWLEPNMQYRTHLGQTGTQIGLNSQSHYQGTGAGTSGLTFHSSKQQPHQRRHASNHPSPPHNTTIELHAVHAGVVQPKTHKSKRQLLPRGFRSTGHTMTGEGVTCSAWGASHHPLHQQVCG